MKVGIEAWPWLTGANAPHNGLFPRTKFYGYSGAPAHLIPPEWANFAYVYGAGGGGGGGCTSGGAPSTPQPGESSWVDYLGDRVALLNGGAAGVNNVNSVRSGGTAVIDLSYESDIFLAETIARNIDIWGVTSGSGVNTDGLTGNGSNSQLSSYGRGGNASSGGAAPGAGGGWCDRIPLYLYRDIPLIFYVGDGGVPGVGDTSGQKGFAGMLLFEFFHIPMGGL